ncbi:MAG: NAD(P)(+) transhydrogenase (Re/Si-specific) subunit beta [Limnothrix sp.]|uniref:NAD(P)(+) transhydrogenase (Re/Si-specific) subunit beta n=1 Tax=unclassified Limnothrix TaxID=2632864 RepID=UPI00081ECC75|nr:MULTISPECIES: NAD(P)(+) transhydrogenase (Re/Si-specific) subunit beta [unclassified Limnothrix]MEB3119323.1 NAD(P)(+) transhydrogenase (Re/Si-specific) subunit beta [Limnothrix sp.]OCQ92050.1 NAD synthetase [Limnothrix sp. P13C2]MBD2161471.1 NAD(P)(+) transhydrogenase (Re/Si-specific) subunit beta [Limnothrix sp. FACHB-1083]MBD2192018.1 NAD(P)(+) transhydrogenase (Re/Si-specific) subunit beta [Limnothrix sp. FACHB-1088]MBD2637185.1 NAD(P)(+) transhydrogenase (Re/Si-specific) subunit beta [
MIDGLVSGVLPAEWWTTIARLSNLAAAALFIVGIKMLGSPATARRGNWLAAVGMAMAIGVTLLDRSAVNYGALLATLVAGSVIGLIAAKRVAMTDMPQMVGLLNGLGGAASALVAAAEYWRIVNTGAPVPTDTAVTVIAGLLIGGVTLTGSFMAFAKLQGLVTGAPITFPLQQPVNFGLLLGFVASGAYLLIHPGDLTVLWLLTGISLVQGVLVVLPIGGADTPVVISLLNSLSGLAASAAGFVLGNEMLVIAGALVGASGLILTQIMCKAMNRSLTNVLFGAFGSVSTATGDGGSSDAGSHTVRSIDPEECAMMLGYARSVAIVPGYGMAVAQAQHAVRELADQLERLGVDVRYAIHPVAGRMPGHMNVLLAEANVPYSQLCDLDDINPDFERVDVALVIGANDVVNPDARDNPQSPIYGMPILEVDRAKHTIVIKRSMNPGFAGLDNALFYEDKTMMLFGSAKEKVSELVASVKELS